MWDAGANGFSEISREIEIREGKRNEN